MRMKLLMGISLGLMLLSEVASADKPLLFKHCVRQSPAIPDYGSVTLRLWPYSAIRRPLSAEGVAFASVIAEDEIVALAASHLLVPLKDKARTPLIISQRTPDTFIFARGNEVTIFPKVLLLRPQVRLAEVRQDDLIASIFVIAHQAGEETVYSPNADKQDRLRTLFFPTTSGTTEANDSKLKIIVEKTILSTEERRVVEQPRDDNFAGFLGGEGKKIEADISKRFGSQLSGRCPVFVVRRKTAGLLIRYVIPLHDSGMFSVDSEIIGRIGFAFTTGNVVTDVIRQQAWQALFENRLGGIEFADGDVIEYTFLELVPPFRQLALP